jgi:riboflavin transporter FmnP
LQRLDTRKLVLASILGALSAVFEIIPGPPFDIPFPLYNRVSWDLTGMPMMISLFFTGPIGAVYTCVIGCSFIFLRGNFYGGIFKIIAELATILAFAAIRKVIVTKSIAAVVSRVLIMTGANYYLLPIFYGMPTSFVVTILPALAVMNATQALINIIPAYIIYSRLGNRWRLRMQETKIIDNISHFLAFSHKRRRLPDRRRNLDNAIHPVSSHPIIS